MSRNVPVIAIDGPAASGKGTIALRVAQSLGWRILNSGIIYRKIAWFMIKENIGIDNIDYIVSMIKTLNIHVYEKYTNLDESSIKNEIESEKVGYYASCIAEKYLIRESLLEYQRSFRISPGLVADGRDIGTIVFPDADLKIFLVANIKTRVHRRYKQLIRNDISVNLKDIFFDLKDRDFRDKNREISPLVIASDAYVLDSSNLTIDETVQSILNFWRNSGPVN
ncbi:MAG: (d)CMP kinase [Bordetella sp.]|nr:MAG: (d)CMP kinase [Bordetella sp.]